MFLCQVSLPQSHTLHLPWGLQWEAKLCTASRGSFLSLLLCSLCVHHPLTVQRLPLGVVFFGSNFIFTQITLQLSSAVYLEIPVCTNDCNATFTLTWTVSFHLALSDQCASTTLP